MVWLRGGTYWKRKPGATFDRQKEQPIFGVSIVRTIKKRRQAFISMAAGPAYHFPGSSLIRNANPRLRSLILKVEMASLKLGCWL
jgi:hypothetical protein